MKSTDDEPKAWVSDEAERAHREQALRQHLTGRSIERVRYVEIRYEAPLEPMWRGASFDSLDYGLELDLDNATTWSIIWKQSGSNEALLVCPGPLTPSQILAGADTAVWDVTPRWR